MEFVNVYQDSQRAEAYAKLEFPGTYYLAYRDLPTIISEEIRGRKALDFGCGTGRSTRFLQRLGFEAIGVDIAGEMVSKAIERDPQGKYHLIQDGTLRLWKNQTFDLVFSSFTFDNIPTLGIKVNLLGEMGRVLKKEGKIVVLASSPDIYCHEWASFSTKEFQENKKAKSGDQVKIIMTDVEDKRPVVDILCSNEEYQKVFQKAGLRVVHVHKPLGSKQEPYRWKNETRIAPWIIYVLCRHAVRPRPWGRGTSPSALPT